MQPYHSYTINLIDSEQMDADITSDVHNVDEVISYSIQASWSDGSTPVGAFVLQGSNDGSVFTDIVSSNVSGNTGSILINVEKHAYTYIRLFYDRSSGDGVLLAVINGKKD